MLAPMDQLSEAELGQLVDLLGDDGEFTKLNLSSMESRLLAAFLITPGVCPYGTALDAMYYDVKEKDRPPTAMQMVRITADRLRTKMKSYIDIEKQDKGYYVGPEQKQLMLSVLGDQPPAKNPVEDEDEEEEAMPVTPLKPVAKNQVIDDDTGIVIEANLPPPPMRRRYHFERMKVGDSFLMECNHEDSKKVISTLQGNVANFKKQMKDQGEEWKFTVRWVNDEKLGTGVRCWRLK